MAISLSTGKEMETPSTLLRLIGKAVLGSAGEELAGDAVTASLPKIVEDVWNDWVKAKDDVERRNEVETLARLKTGEINELSSALVKELTPGRTLELRESLTNYLRQVPASIRHAFRRPTTPAGTSLPDGLSLRKSEDLLPFLPVRVPRFRAGDTPIPGVDWELVELLGVGGFGEVWKARNPHMSSATPVALKFCLDPASAKVLRNEAKLLDRLMSQGRHPGIVPLRQTYLSADPPCLEYEYIPGGDLTGMIHEWHRQGKSLNPQQAASVMRRLAKIVGFAHRLDPPIVHRDLKPANILVQKMDDGSLSLKVADFGNGGVAASHAIRQTLRGTSQAQLLVSALRGACTPLYASPQQMRGFDADPRDDVYSLGIIWYQLLTGELSSGRPGGTRWPKRLTDQGMPEPMVELLGTCMEDNPTDRPRNADALAEQLSALLKKVGAPAPAPTSGEGQSAELPRRITNSTKITLMLIPAGTFRMGSPNTETDRSPDEGPQHEVTLSKSFYMAIYPVTQIQYQGVMGNTPAYFNANKGGGFDFPVENISWDDANEFCRKLSELPAEKAAGRTYRLPTEAEWEYTCRAGLPTPVSAGFTLSSLDANFNGNYPYGPTARGPYLERTTRVGSYPSNPFGICDMHGNVWEWCSDYYDRNYYRNSPATDPRGPDIGASRVVRGGSCYNIGRFCRTAYRFGVTPTNRDIDVGMRVVMDVVVNSQ